MKTLAAIFCRSMLVACAFVYVLLMHYSLEAQCVINFKDKFEDIVFVSPSVGFSVGAHGLILKTVDGGETWVQLLTGSTIAFKDVEFFNDQIGLAGGIGGILKTEDAGTTWQSIYKKDINNITLLTATTYIATGQGEILKTQNGGETWNVMLTNTGVAYSDISVSTSSNLFAVQHGGGNSTSAIIRSLNGGESWEVIKPMFGEQLADLTFTSSAIGYAIGEHDTFLKTTNGGQNWSEIVTTLPGGSQNIFFIDDTHGFIYNNEDVHYCWKTSDGGVSLDWITLPAGTVNNILYFTDSSTGVLSGSNASSSNFYKTANGGTLWLNKEAKPEIEGATASFQGAIVEYTVQPMFEATYMWVVAGGEIKGNSTENKVRVLWTSPLGSVSVKIESLGLNCSYTLLINVNSPTTVPAEECLFERTKRINDITFVNRDIGFMAGDGGQMFKTINGGEDWIQLNTNSSIDFYKVNFLNDQFGLVGGNGGLLKTEDGGKRWVIVSSANISSIHIVDTKTFYVTDGTLKKTTDGGKSWETLVSITYYAIGAVQFTADGTGFALYYHTVDLYSTGIIKTSDDWKNYTLIEVSKNQSSDSDIANLTFTDSQTGYAITRGGAFLKSINGGTTWKYIFHPLSLDPKMSIHNEVILLYRLYGSEHRDGGFYKSIDGGNTWQFVDHPGSFAQAVYFFDKNSGLLEATTSTATYGYSLFQTSDGGVTWNARPDDPSIVTSPMTCLSDVQTFSVGEYINTNYHWEVSGGTIEGSDSNNEVEIRWEDPGSALVKVRISGEHCVLDRTLDVTVAPAEPCAVTGIESYDHDSVIVIFPMPTANTAKLRIQNNYMGNIEYVILMNDGRQLDRGAFFKETSDFETDLKLDRLNEGFYVLKLFMGGNDYTRKMVIVR